MLLKSSGLNSCLALYHYDFQFGGNREAAPNHGSDQQSEKLRSRPLSKPPAVTHDETYGDVLA